MAKLNRQLNLQRDPLRSEGPIRTSDARVTNYEGVQGYTHDVKSALFLLGVTNFVGEDTFYEKAADRDRRYAALVEESALQDPLWTANFLIWLRREGNMRHASLVGAAHFVKARLGTGSPEVMVGSRGVDRALVDMVCVRGDEPADLLAYWLNTFGRNVPKPVKRGLGDAARRLFTEFNLLKYDTGSRAVRWGDLIEIVHPSAGTPLQGALFRYALDRRRNDAQPADALRMIRAQAEWHRNAANGVHLGALIDPDHLQTAGLTWEDVLSALGGKYNKRKLWEAMIPNMGYMALLRNLRNFDEAGIGQLDAEYVARRLSDPAQVAKSRQFPYRFLAAYESLSSVRWSAALDAAIIHSVANVPDALKDSLILVDTSASMTTTSFSKRSTMTAAKAASIFGVALAMKGADLFGFANSQFRHEVRPGSSLIEMAERFVRRTGEVGHGTFIGEAVRSQFVPGRHKRIFIISDMQTMDPVTGIIGGYRFDHSQNAVVPADVAVYAFNLGGYRTAAFPTGARRVTLGGLTDATFKMVPLIEAGQAATWPWEKPAEPDMDGDAAPYSTLPTGYMSNSDGPWRGRTTGTPGGNWNVSMT
jgi:hypothetical protein